MGYSTVYSFWSEWLTDRIRRDQRELPLAFFVEHLFDTFPQLRLFHYTTSIIETNWDLDSYPLLLYWCTMRIFKMSTTVSTAAVILRLLLVDPVYWAYYTLLYLIRCCRRPCRNKSFAYNLDSGKSTYYLQGDLVVHERQSLQLCAVHTINNLLQLTTEQQHQHDRALPWICGNVRWPERPPEPASQHELDAIACELTHAEDALLHNRRTAAAARHYIYPWSDRCCCWNSNHRTVYYGNYSFETLEVALQHRHVSLEWFQLPTGNNPDDLLKVTVPVGTSNNSSNNSIGGVDSSTNSIVVGFIINKVVDDNGGADTTTTTTGCNSVLQKCCDDPGRHWYAITRVRRSDYLLLSEEAPEEDRWKIIDSDRIDDATILRRDQLRDYLYQLWHHQDATIFRAVLTKPNIKTYE